MHTIGANSTAHMNIHEGHKYIVHTTTLILQESDAVMQVRSHIVVSYCYFKSLRCLNNIRSYTW